MGSIDISFSKKQIENLIYALFIGTWVSESNEGESEYNSEIEKLEQYVLATAYSAKWFDWIEYEEKLGMYYVSQAKEEELLKDLIDKYNQENFWAELEDQLSLRDVVKKYGKEKIESMDLEELARERFEITDHYADEFEEYGVDRLQIKK
jgi:hypothetical protein